MNVSQVKQMARQWTSNLAQKEPAYLGSFFAGSINRMHDAAPWQPLSDVDIFTLVDREFEGWSQQEKLLHEGIIIESVIFPISRFQTEEQLLTRVDTINLTHDTIIDDPFGYLAERAELIARRYRANCWTQRRCQNGKAFVLSECLPGMLEASSLPEQILNLLLAVVQIAQLPALAQNQNPTVRKGLLVARDLLAEQEAAYESILRLLGSTTLSTTQAFAHLQACERAFDYATTVIQTPFWGDYDVNQEMRPIAIAGGYSLIAAGFPREAMWWVLFIHTLAMIAIQNDAPAADKANFLAAYRQIVAEFGLGLPQQHAQRAALGTAVVNNIYTLSLSKN
ncbi:MAG: hypothetical protein AAF614_21155 [Chloroflexota bacterium]